MKKRKRNRYEEDDFEEDYEEEEGDEEEEDEEEEDDDDDDEEEEEEEDDEEEEEDEEEEDDDDDEEDDEEEEEDPPPRPPKKKKQRKKKAASKENLYVVQKGFEQGEREYEAGDTIKIACRTCALWERELMGKVQCFPGAVINDDTGEEMEEGKYSCRTFYINRENEEQLESYQEFNVQQAEAVRKLMTPYRKFIEAQLKLREELEEKKMSADSIMGVAESWLQEFTHPLQILHLERFIRQWNKGMKKRLKKSATQFSKGDMVEYFNERRSDKVVGIIFERFRGRVKIAVTKVGGKDKTGLDEFHYLTWRDTMNPEILAKAVDEDDDV
jgi:hypothetical protein